jgi:hypothetical protein
MARSKIEYLECLDEKEKSYGQEEGIGIIVKKCFDRDCSLRDECSKFRLYPAKDHQAFVKNLFSTLES